MQVDGLELGPLQDRARLLPGSHRITAAVLIHTRAREVLETRELELHAEAGHSYALHAGWGLYGPSVWITDTETERPVVTAPTPRLGEPPPVGAR
jgi:hypothetical protein